MEVRYLAEQVGITEVYAQKSPEDKLAIVRKETASAKTLYVGDGINDTEDLGLGSWAGPLGGRIGPFLTWDPAVAPLAPDGYIGNPGVEHKIVDPVTPGVADGLA